MHRRAIRIAPMTRPDKWLDVNSHSEVCSVARQALAMRLLRVAKNLRRAAKASAKQAEDIHRLRTWSRRAAAAVELLRPLLAGKQGKWFDKKLRKIRRAAGEVRDLDVMCKQLEEERASKETSDLLGDLQDRRKDAQQPLRKLQKR